MANSVSDELSYLVFVYGTLKSGQPNQDVITNVETGSAQFVANGQTLEKYPLVIASKFNIPFLLDKKSLGHNVQGEIYRVCERKLSALDDLENHPHFYIRREEMVQILDPNMEGTNMKCWIYFLPKFKQEVLELKPHENYDAYGSHGLRYVERYRREGLVKQGYSACTDVGNG